MLGLVGLVGAFIFCGVTLLVSPFAWGVGHSALKDIRASQGRIGGESQARTGMILGIVGTALLILAVVVAAHRHRGGDRVGPVQHHRQLGLATWPRLELAADQHRLVDQGDPEPFLHAVADLPGERKQLRRGGLTAVGQGERVP